MTHARSTADRSPVRVLDGWGRSLRAACLYRRVQDQSELSDVLRQARDAGMTVSLRGAGRSYGDLALNARGLVVDTSGMNRMLHWNPVDGIADAEPGLTIEGLWRRTLQDGHWPAVVPGTMRSTLGGCLATNIHGKNNFHVGPFGDHVVEFDMLTGAGEQIRCSRNEHPEIFHAAIGGLGLLGAITRIRLRTRRVESGWLRVEPIAAPTLDDVLDRFDEHLGNSDYLVGWIDGLARGRSLGRGLLHRANYVQRDELPRDDVSLHVESQGLPAHILGLPKSAVWRFMLPFMSNCGIRAVNAAKYHTARSSAHGRSYLQSHVAFAFLLDYVPNWKARRVISAAGALNTVRALLPAETRAMPWAQQIAALRPSPCHVCLYLGFKGDIRNGGASAANQWFYETWSPDATMWQIEDPRADAPVLYCSFPSLKDPRHDPGPEQLHTGEVVTFVPYDAFAPHRDGRWMRRGETYEALKDELAARLKSQFLRHMPALAPYIAYAELSTPLSTEHFTRASQGAIYGIEPTPERYRARSLRPRTPVRGLFLTGSDVASVGVMGAMVGGVLTAAAAEPARVLPFLRAAVARPA